MEDIFNAIAGAPVANLFIIGGLFFVAVAILGKISGKIEPSSRDRAWAGVIGTLFLLGGLALHLMSPSSGQARDEATAPTAAVIDVARAVEPTPVAPATRAPATLAASSGSRTIATATVEAPPSATPRAEASRPAPLPAARWTRLGDLPRRVNALVADPADAGVIYAGAGGAGSGTGVYRSTDGGATWADTSQGLPAEDVQALAFAAGSPATLLAAVGGEVYGSVDGVWSLLGDAGPFGMYRALYPHPTELGTIYMVSRPEGILRSRNGGAGWTVLGGGLPGDEHETYVMSLAIDSSSPDVLYAGTGGWVGHGNGVWKSTDGGATWVVANRGMIDYRISAVAVDPSNPQRIYAGGDAGELFVSDDGAGSWRDLTGNLPYDVSTHATVVAIAVDALEGRLYLLCHYVGLLVSADGGASWESLGAPPSESSPTFTALVVLPGAQPVAVVGTESQGSWRYAP